MRGYFPGMALMAGIPIDSHTAHILAKRAPIERLSAGARHAAMPTIYAKPVPLMAGHEGLRAENIALRAQCKALEAVNDQLNRRFVSQQAEIKRLLASHSRIVDRPVTIAEVTKLYLEALERVGHSLDGTIYTSHDLAGPRRARQSAWPRMVCMWLCRRLCPMASTPVIARTFGGRDHTTVLHACERAPFIIERSPSLKTAAEIVLATFEKEGAP
jgi:hypothetical protein